MSARQEAKKEDYIGREGRGKETEKTSRNLRRDNVAKEINRDNSRKSNNEKANSI